jgi:hypothetical protein
VTLELEAWPGPVLNDSDAPSSQKNPSAVANKSDYFVESLLLRVSGRLGGPTAALP